MRSSTVRIDEESLAILRAIKRQEEDSATSIIHRALEEYRRKLFLKQCSDAYSTLKSNKKSWKEETAEREAWDTTVSDGLEKEK
jgi:hypothetical protein